LAIVETLQTIGPAAFDDRNIFSKFLSLTRVLRPHVICDIGSLNAAESTEFRKASPGSIVFAFEANPYNYAPVHASGAAARNGVHWQYVAVSDDDGLANFHVLSYERSAGEPAWQAGASSLLERIGPSAAEKVVVPVVRLDTFLDRKHLLNAGKALWIDAEGTGLRVLLGAERSLAATLFLKIELEGSQFWQGQSSDEAAIRFLQERGFVPLTSLFQGRKPVQYDVIFIRRELAGLPT
jgi:FkbM family methyltransferase